MGIIILWTDDIIYFAGNQTKGDNIPYKGK